MKGGTLALLLLMAILSIGQIEAQQQIELIHAGSMTVKRVNTRSTTFLKDQVQLQNKDGRFFCDSAIWWKSSDKLIAYGHVRYVGFDGLLLEGTQLDYREGSALVKGPVTLRHKDRTLSAPLLKYDMNSKTGHFYEGGLIHTQDGSMTCRTGTYSANEGHFTYEGKVIAETEKYQIVCEKLEQWPDEHRYYVPSSGIARTKVAGSKPQRFRGSMEFGRAWLWSGGESSRSTFSLGVKGSDSTVVFQSDSLHSAGGTTTLFSSFSEAYWSDWSGDSLEIHGAEITSSSSEAFAVGQVETFARQMVCKSDSMHWSPTDSVIHLCGQVNVWVDEYVLSSDSLSIFQHHPSGLDSLFGGGMVNISKPSDSTGYDEMGGNFLYGFLEPQGLKALTLKGNAEAYIQPDMDRRAKIQCSAINLQFEEGKLKQVFFNQTPEGIVSKPAPIEHLPGFAGESAQRPARMEAISGLK